MSTRERGFSLIEVMVALIIIAVGLLGIGKMQALAVASTTSASQRSLAAIEAASLAAAMHANRDYWDTSPPVTTTVTGMTITSTTAGFPGAPVSCTSPTAPCGNVAQATYDLQQWTAALNQLLPNPSATINCPSGQPPPLSCTIQVSWAEKAVAINTQEAANSSAAEGFDSPTYTLYVEP